jgi:tRNA(Ile)-lysidine synthase
MGRLLGVMTTTAPVDLLIAAVNAQIGRVGPGLYGVACSGGADSLALADAAITAAGPSHVVVLAIDHGLVAGSAEVSERVAAWARGQGAAAVVRRVDVRRRGSLEAAARTARYAALDALADELGLACVLVGHTARDQAETVVLRLLRGTGPAGLAGMAIQRGRFVRPFLALERAAIDAYARVRDLPVWHDPMNRDRRLARVRAREEILPALRRENPRLDAALVRLAGSCGEWLEVIDALARPLARFPIDGLTLAAQPPAIRKRAVSLALEAAGLDYDAHHLDRIDDLITARDHGQRTVEVRGGSVIRSYGVLSLAGAPPVAAAIATPDGFEVRAWRAGDRMRPARLKGRSRKLSDLYIDAKVPRILRDAARVVVRISDATIVWAEHLGSAFGESWDPVVAVAAASEDRAR